MNNTKLTLDDIIKDFYSTYKKFYIRYPTTIFIKEEPQQDQYYKHSGISTLLYKNEWGNVIESHNATNLYEIHEDSLLLFLEKKKIKIKDEKKRYKLYHIFLDNKGNKVLLRLAKRSQTFNHILTRVI